MFNACVSSSSADWSITSRATAVAAAAACQTSEDASSKCPMTCFTAEGLQTHQNPGQACNQLVKLPRNHCVVITSRAAAVAVAAACLTSGLASPRCPMTCFTAEGASTQFPSCHSPWADDALAGTGSLRASHSMARRASFEGQAPARWGG